MARKKNVPLRIIVPLVVVLAGIGFAIAVMRNSARPPATPGTKSAQADPSTPQSPSSEPPATGKPASEPPPTQPPATDPPANDPAATQPAAEPPATTPDSPAQPDPPVASGVAAELDGLLAAEIGNWSPDVAFAPLGGLEPEGAYKLRIAFSRYGAGIERVELASYFLTTRHEEHVPIQREVDHGSAGVTPFAADVITINGQAVRLQGVVGSDGLEKRIWQQVSPGVFRAEVHNAAGQAVLEIVRTYELATGEYEFTLRQSLRNLTDKPLRVTYTEFGPSDLPDDSGMQMGDRRRVRFGYLRRPEVDPAQKFVYADSALKGRDSALGKKVNGRYEPVLPLWPTRTAQEREYVLSWAAFTSRYFGVSVHSTLGQGTAALSGERTIERMVLNRANTRTEPPVVSMRLTTAELTVAPGQARSLDMAVYAGPLQRSIINAQPHAQDLSLDRLVVLNLGGICAGCTFSWLTEPLLGLLRILHNYLFHDWALAIIGLVFVVRTILHPVTKWSQIRLQQFGKRMQAIAPKQKKVQEKYCADRKRLQLEMQKLWREEGISPAGMLGCLPMFLQMPVWIAVYAMIYYAFDLRHQPAFFGVFQQMTGGDWKFLADLAQPDALISFGGGFDLPLIGHIDSFNLLPFVFAFVLFIHQKYISPSNAAMTPEQKQQQAIIKWMSVILLPIIMYNAPAGLGIYFIANSTVAIIESRLIKRHMEKHDLLNVDKLKARRAEKGPGFFQRMRKMAEMQAQLRQQQQAGRGGPGGRKGGPPSRRPEPPPNRFKKR